MWNRLRYYVSLAWSDLIRFRSSALLQSLIVAGVCFPVLILLSLKRGHVEELREELVKSPSGRLIKIYPAGGGRPFTLAELDPLAGNLGNVELAIPYVRRIVDLSSIKENGGNQNRKSISVKNVDVYATSPGDPMLVSQNADVIEKGEDAIVLYDSVSKSLNVAEGEKLRLTITRSKSGGTGSVELLVKKIIPSSSNDKIGFVDSTLINRFTKFIRGGGVPEWNWHAVYTPPVERYPTFLLINDAGDPLKPGDFKSLELLQFKVEKVTSLEEETLGGALLEKNRNKVIIYRLTHQDSADAISSRMSDKLVDISRSTLATDAAIPWCHPREEMINGKKIKLIGLTLPPRCKWLHNLLLSPRLGFEITSDYRQFQVASQSTEEKTITKLTVDDDVSISLKKTPTAKSISTQNRSKPKIPALQAPRIRSPVVAVKPDVRNPNLIKSQNGSGKSDSNQNAPSTKPVKLAPEKIFVPAKLLAYLDEYRAGTAAFDPQVGELSSIISEPTYEDALVFANTIDDVPEIVANAVKQNFPFNAENARIEEIQKQDGSLQKLVVIVGLLVFSFGILTVFGVLWESTARKRSVIGIMRVMGVTPKGAFLIVVLRAMILGVFAGCLTVLAGYLCVLLLTWEPSDGGQFGEWLKLKPVISAVIDNRDIYLVLASSILCCVVGSLAPALSASRLDPFDALIQGRYR